MTRPIVPPPATITVLVVDDDPFVRRGVSDIFAAAPDISVVADVDDGDRVPDAVTRLRPHVVLMDLQMSRVGGLEATRLLLAQPRPPRVIAMTVMDVDSLVVAAIEAGAHSFLSKSEAPETFHQSVRAVASGNTLFSQDSLRKILASAPASAQVSTGAAEAQRVLARLSPREHEILRTVATGASNADIGRELFLAESTVKTHVTSMLTKLEVANRVQAALVAFRAGVVT